MHSNDSIQARFMLDDKSHPKPQLRSDGCTEVPGLAQMGKVSGLNQQNNALV